MKESTRKTAAHVAVKWLIQDMTGRRGLRHEWDQVDDDIKARIVNEWERLVAQAFLLHQEEP